MLPLRSILFAALALCAVLTSGMSIAGCAGDQKSAQTTVARIDSHRITLSELEHWTDVEAVLAYETEPKKPVPAGVIPDPPSYAKCIAYSKTVKVIGQPPTQRTPAQLKRQCEARRGQLMRHVLDILIIYYWLRGEGEERAMKISSPEIEQVRRRIFPTGTAYRRYLTLTGERPEDERLIIEKDLLDTKLLHVAEASSKPKPTTTRQRQQLLVRASTAFTDKWKARTSCIAGYVVSECKQYKGPPSPVAP